MLCAMHYSEMVVMFTILNIFNTELKTKPNTNE